MTSRQALIEALKAYHTPFNDEMGFVLRFQNLLQEPDAFKRELPTGHLTASAWVVNEDRSKVLLLHHAKLDKWLQPGGHADGNEYLLEVASKELAEETGLRNFRTLSEQIFDLDIHTIPERKGVPEHEHFDVRFCFQANEQEPIERNAESNDVAWVPIGNIPNEWSLQRMVLKTKSLKGIEIGR